MKKEIFDSFFIPYAKTVDTVANVSAFWRLSDALITEIIKREIAPYCTDDSLVMDAGGGTGRWSVKLSECLKGKLAVFDRSEDMLEKAKANIANSKVSDRISTELGDLTNIEKFKNESVDHIVSIYSPLSFIYEQEQAASELYRILKPGGRILVMSHSFLNALASKINNYQASAKEIKKLADTQMVTWAPHVPELVTHSKESIEKLFSEAGFTVHKTYGVPVFVQPGPEDFDPNNEQHSNVSTYLEDPEVFQSIFDFEMNHNSDNTACNRGMNMFVLAEKK